MTTSKLLEFEYSSPSMLFFQDRLKTFDMWPPQIEPNKFQLSSAGFYYTGRNDTVECFSCGLRLHQWQKGDESLLEHKTHSPSCLFLNIIGHHKNDISWQHKDTRSSSSNDSSRAPWTWTEPLAGFQYGDIPG